MYSSVEVFVDLRQTTINKSSKLKETVALNIPKRNEWVNTNHIVNHESIKLKITVFLVFVKPLFSVFHEQFILAKGSIDRSINERRCRVLTGRIYLSTTKRRTGIVVFQRFVHILLGSMMSSYFNIMHYSDQQSFFTIKSSGLWPLLEFTENEKRCFLKVNILGIGNIWNAAAEVKANPIAGSFIDVLLQHLQLFNFHK